jgi:hypothetical protein
VFTLTGLGNRITQNSMKLVQISARHNELHANAMVFYAQDQAD